MTNLHAAGSASPPDGLSRRERQRLETRERIYNTALAEFREVGVAEAQIDRIAEKAGIARGTFYFHFSTKEHVLIELQHRAERALVERIEALGPPPESVVDIFKLASEYTLRTLAVKCLDIMCDSVTVENALSIFSLSEAHLPLTDRLKAKCVEVIRDNVKEVSQSPSFADLCTDPELVKQLIVPLASPPRKRARTCDSAD